MNSLTDPRLATIGGVVLVVLGGVLAGVLLFTTPFTGCTEVGVPDDVDSGYEFVGIENGNIVYSPDGVNTCQSPLQVIAIPLIPLGGGLVLLAYGRYSTNQPAEGSQEPAGR